jgi:hypothetical protein
MPYEITWESGLAFVRYKGFVSNAEIESAFDELYRDQRYPSIAFVLSDLTELQSHELDKDRVLILGARRLGSTHLNKIVRDVVVSADDRVLALLRRNASINLLPRTVLYFASLAEARAWIKSAPGAAANSESNGERRRSTDQGLQK